MLRLRSTTIGFKEWSLVCEALGAGVQSLILRKGGIAEGKGGFQWQASRFLLFPTHFHEQAQQVSWTPPHLSSEVPSDEQIIIQYAAEVQFTAQVSQWETALTLAPHHIWKETVVRERFGYGAEPGLSLAFVRIYRLASPLRLQPQPSFGGCRSWLDLPEHSLDDATAVLTPEENAQRADAVRQCLAPEAETLLKGG